MPDDERPEDGDLSDPSESSDPQPSDRPETTGGGSANADATTDTGSGAADDRRSGMGGTVVYTVLGAVLPGTGLIAARRRLADGIVFGVFAGVVLGVGVWAIADTGSLIGAAVSPGLLRGVAVGLIVVGLAWMAVIILTYRSVRHAPMTRVQRVASTVLVGMLCLLVAAPVAVAARYGFDQAGLVSTVFQHERQSHSATRPDGHTSTQHHRGRHQGSSKSGHRWAGKSRVNVLLLGGDAGVDRTGNRTDTVMVASIDTRTGDTTLIGLPRNTARMPFPKNSPLHTYYPDGFTDGNSQDANYFLNSMYGQVPNKTPTDVLGKTDNLGADAMKISVGHATGLKLDYYVLINLKGFRQLIDALGGVTVNINEYVAIGGDTDKNIPPDSYLKPGHGQHLNGSKTLWFARGRYGADDFQRMDRQRCVMDAIIDQAHPANVLSRYEKIVKVGKKIVRTDIPQEKLSDFAALSRRAKNGHVRSLIFKNGKNRFHSAHPDFHLMRKQVKKSLGEATHPPHHTKAKSKPSTAADSPQSHKPSAGSPSRSTKNACAWHPHKAATAQPPR